MIALLLAALSLYALVGCGPPREPCTEAGARRCLGDEVQICDSDLRWATAARCAETEPGAWVCVEAPAGATCEEQGE